MTADWVNFDAIGADLFGPDWTAPTTPQARHMAALHPAVVLLLPLLPDDRARQLVEPLLNGVTKVADDEAFLRWAAGADSAGALEALNRRLFQQLQALVHLWECWMPGLVVHVTQPEQRALLEQLRLARDDFAVLRDLYVQVFETCSRGLFVPMAILNTEYRGDPDSFGAVPAVVKQSNAKALSPTSLRVYSELPNSIKAKWFEEWPAWARLVPQMLDSRLRNAIGHASVAHDVTSGNIVSDTFTINYLDFVAAVFDLVSPMLVLLQAVKSARLIVEDNRGSAPAVDPES